MTSIHPGDRLDSPMDMDEWEQARVAIKEAHEYLHYGTNEDAEEAALRYTILALERLYALLKPPSAHELFH